MTACMVLGAIPILLALVVLGKFLYDLNKGNFG